MNSISFKKVLIIVIAYLLSCYSGFSQNYDSLFIRNFADSVGTKTLVAYSTGCEGCEGCGDKYTSTCDCKPEESLMIIYEIGNRLHKARFACCEPLETIIINGSESWNYFNNHSNQLLKHEKVDHYQRKNRKLIIRDHYFYKNLMLLIEDEYVSYTLKHYLRNYQRIKKRFAKRLADKLQEEF